MSQRRPRVLIAAVARNGVIGLGERLPWHLPGDLAHFRESTMGRPVILGRTTFEAIGRPLPGRFPVVLSRDPAFRPAAVAVARTVEEAIGMAETIALREDAPEVMIAGGASVYAASMDVCDALMITEVELDPVGDAVFPTIDSAAWEERERRRGEIRPEDEAGYSFVRYARRDHLL